ncbi:MAG: imelysin family protein [Alphaproteobacteria bacterium]|nr:imelysin family protein [Alphaproteobacteria bacterium]MCB9696625.1 imelysin family protein [Alphaproteobacteria bacterium]
MIWWWACTPGTDPRAEVIEGLAADTTARYEAFEARAATLDDAVAAMCAGTGSLEDAREAWQAAREPWKRAQIVAFGPVVTFPERYGPKLDDWPVDADAVEALVASDAPVSAADFAAMGTATRGLPVVEWLLYGESPEDARRCAVLAGAAGDVHATATALSQAWRDGWQERLGSPETRTDDDWDTVQDVIDEWVNRSVYTLADLRGLRLGKPLGDDTGGVPQPQLVESRPSGRSLRDARDVLQGVRATWEGDAGPGLRSLVEDGALTDRVEGLFDGCDARLAEVPEPLETTVGEQPEIVARAQDALQALQITMQLEVVQALSVTLAFSDNDGD